MRSTFGRVGASRDYLNRYTVVSIDDVVGTGEDCGRYREAEVFRGLEVDDEIEFHRLLISRRRDLLSTVRLSCAGARWGYPAPYRGSLPGVCRPIPRRARKCVQGPQFQYAV